MKKFLAISTAGVLLIAGATTATALQDEGEWHTWEVQGNYGPNWDQDHHQAFDEPQVYLGEGQLDPKCETWVQVDFYSYEGEAKGASIESVIADGLPHKGEDYHLTNPDDGGDWYFQYGGPCPDPKPTPGVTPEPSPEPKAPPAVPVETAATFTG